MGQISSDNVYFPQSCPTKRKNGGSENIKPLIKFHLFVPCPKRSPPPDPKKSGPNRNPHPYLREIEWKKSRKLSSTARIEVHPRVPKKMCHRWSRVDLYWGGGLTQIAGFTGLKLVTSDSSFIVCYPQRLQGGPFLEGSLPLRAKEGFEVGFRVQGRPEGRARS